MKNYRFVANVIVLDRSTATDKRFSVIKNKPEPTEADAEETVHEFAKDDTYLGADRVEMGTFLIERGYLEEKKEK